MPLGTTYAPKPLFAALGDEFADGVLPAEFPKLLLRRRDDRHAASIGLEDLSETEWISAFGRFEPLAGNQSVALAMRYHGHQFRVYNPDLGDGRGFLFAQLRDRRGRILDLGTKGSGRTPWSRGGDGRLTLKGGVREVLATAMLEALGVNTSKSLSLIETGEALVRGDEPSPTRSAVLTRLSHSHIRFGTFQRLAFIERLDLTEALLGHVGEIYAPEMLAAAPAQRPTLFLKRTIAMSARLLGTWMAAGFVHGVLNTDNMNINGESFDYGPYRFLPHNDPNFTAAYFDHAGLYAFGRQPEAVLWNLQQLAGAFVGLTPETELLEALQGFQSTYQRELVRAMLRRLALRSCGWDKDVDLVGQAFRALAAGGEALRWEPFFFDWFGGDASQERALRGPRASLYGEEAFLDFRSKLSRFEPEAPERLQAEPFSRAEPEELLVEDVEAAWRPIASADDWSAFNAKLARLEASRQAYGLSELGAGEVDTA